ncbi:desmoglein-2-like [Scleropages formosus]|uniref:desmoglein-2-like n=1 Tax=Scleropages formosus TaxID=113540 RepID=UPI0010FAA8CB|nr:desmoglein-2-like [Scleropages formosus]
MIWFLIVVVLKNDIDATQQTKLRRQKREWVIPTKLVENKDYRNRDYIAKIRSDSDLEENVNYFLEGPGATEDPVNLFIVNQISGFVRVTGILDREKISRYNMKGFVKFSNGSSAEDSIDLIIEVVDENDNSPIFEKLPPVSVMEASSPGTFVTQVNATDKDDPETLHAKIAYKIIHQEPQDIQNMFEIRSETGEIYVTKPTLDRERSSSYILTIEASDMDGKPWGNTGTTTMKVIIEDINDNIPSLEKDEYDASVDENTADVEVLRMKVLDNDLENTDNWLAMFEIVSGNEDGIFSIETDPKTNEGVLILRKEVDYEKVQNFQLGVVVSNVAPMQAEAKVEEGDSVSSMGPSSSSGSGSSSATSQGIRKLKQYPIKINMRNLKDMPKFSPSVMTVSVSEDRSEVKLQHPIATYPAFDEDTGKIAKNVRYAKGYDPENWLSVDENTAEIKLMKIPDRESKNVINGTYHAKIICMTSDLPSQTATGTIALQVQDTNDYCPHLSSTYQSQCSGDHPVIVTAVDEDFEPNAAPFEFAIVPERTRGQWKLQTFDDKSAVLRSQDDLWPGFYEVTMIIKDRQGLACPDNQVLRLDVCTCTENGDCNIRSDLLPSKSFGIRGIFTAFLGVLLLIFVPLLLLFCTCRGAGAGGIAGGFADIPFDTKEYLIAYHTEGQGEDKEVPLMHIVADLDNGFSKTGWPPVPVGTGLLFTSMTGGGASSFFQANDLMEMDYMPQRETIDKDQGSSFLRFERAEGDIYDGIALPDHYLKDNFAQKASCAAGNEATKEDLLAFNFEGHGSPVGSVGCCSLLEADNDLEFLNNLGPKFKTLAEICRGPEVEPEVSVPPPQPKAEHTTMTSVVTNSALSASSLPPPSSHVEKHVVAETSRTATLPSVTVRENAMIPNQAYVIQQPVYLASTPVLQTTQYVMEPQVHNTVLVSELPSVSNMQTMYVVDGVPGPESVIMKERVVTGPAVGGVVSSSVGTGQVVREGLVGVNSGLVGMKNLYGSQNLILLEGAGSGGQLLQNGTLQKRDLSGSQKILLVDGQMASGQVIPGGSSWVQQGSLHRGNLSGSQNIHIVDGQGASGLVVQAGTSGLTQGVLGVMGLSGGSFQVNGFPVSEKVITKEKKVVSLQKIPAEDKSHSYSS